MVSEHLRFEHRVAEILKDHLKEPSQGLTFTKLQGDASSRIYYRLSLASGKTFILMKLPEGASSISEEITNLKEKPAEIPFVSVGRFLEALKLPVPHIHFVDEKAGLILLEDLGDETLESRVHDASENEKKTWYQKAIDLLVEFQEKTSSRKSDCLVYQRSFDETLLQWEFQHFAEYGIEARLERTIDDEDRKKIQQGFNFITFALTKIPKILVHRDFQSRNLMVQNNALRLIDFQDALMGPLVYDLVALLRDSYISLSWNFVSERIDDYLKKQTGAAVNPDFLKKMFDWMTIQRKLKDAGRFVYIDRVKKNPNFLKHIPNSLAHVRQAFERQPELHPLFEILKKYVPEFN